MLGVVLAGWKTFTRWLVNKIHTYASHFPLILLPLRLFARARPVFSNVSAATCRNMSRNGAVKYKWKAGCKGPKIQILLAWFGVELTLTDWEILWQGVRISAL
jgi:hypothetical protein